MGLVSTVVATVLSTTRCTSVAWATLATAARSAMSHIGFAGVSTQISRVRPGRIERSTASRSLESMNSTSRPHVNANSASHFRTPQYNTRETSTWSPGTSDWKIAVVAAIPEANKAQLDPPSSAASSRSASSKVGLSARV